MIVYHIKEGDTLWQIAKENQITLEELLAANPKIIDPNTILAGDTIYIPTFSDTHDEENINPEHFSDQNNTRYRTSTYIAHNGDTLRGIAARNDISLPMLMEYNKHLSGKKQLQKGNKVYIPASEKINMDNMNMNERDIKGTFSQNEYCPYCGRYIRS